MTASKRPWHVFVRNVGPTYTFASEAAAENRARALVTTGDTRNGGAVYAEVLVYAVGGAWENPPRRRVHRFERKPVEQLLVDGQWVTS